MFEFFFSETAEDIGESQIGQKEKEGRWKGSRCCPTYFNWKWSCPRISGGGIRKKHPSYLRQFEEFKRIVDFLWIMKYICYSCDPEKKVSAFYFGNFLTSRNQFWFLSSIRKKMPILFCKNVPNRTRSSLLYIKANVH